MQATWWGGAPGATAAISNPVLDRDGKCLIGPAVVAAGTANSISIVSGTPFVIDAGNVTAGMQHIAQFIGAHPDFRVLSRSYGTTPSPLAAR